MGVNRVGFGIVDDAVVQEASKQEIIRRYFNAGCEYKKGYIDYPTFQRAELIMRNLNLTEEDRKCVAAARKKAETSGILSAVALELPDGNIITGRQSELMDASSAAILNAVKYLADFDDKLLLLSPVILEPILTLKEKL